MLARERSIAPQDIEHTNIALVTNAGLQRSITDIIVVYDSVYGGLRLTENLFDEFSQFVERLRLGAELSQGDGIVSAETAESLQQWKNSLSESASDEFAWDFPEIDVPEGWLQIYKPGSEVGIYSVGMLQERELIEPRYIDDPFNPGTKVLYYSYRDARNKNGVSYTPADGIVPSGHDWDLALWNPDTSEYKDLELPN